MCVCVCVCVCVSVSVSAHHRASSSLAVVSLTGSGTVAVDRGWQLSPSEIVKHGVIRAGLFGDVLCGEWGQRPVAVSLIVTFSSQASDDFVDRSFAKVAADYRELRHANLATFMGAGIFSDGSFGQRL